MIEIISATRFSEMEFWDRSALGQSLRRLSYDQRLKPSISFSNQAGLPEIYNARIGSSSDEALVFVHDDVWLDDFFLGDSVLDALENYDVVGLAGNRRRAPCQPSWIFLDSDLIPDDATNLSGAVAHGPAPFGEVSYFGQTPAACELIDGVFIAVRKSSLVASGVMFDPQFDFHFYDLDFCRSAKKNGLKIGTWPICITHQSTGAYCSEGWWDKYRRYLDKWDE